MRVVNFKKEIISSLEEALKRVESALKTEGFGILTRIDFHSKIKEKLNQEMPATIILGACNPSLAHQAFLKNSDVTSMLPCNVVVRDLGQGKMSIEVVKPSVLMEILADEQLIKMAREADSQLLRAMEKI